MSRLHTSTVILRSIRRDLLRIVYFKLSLSHKTTYNIDYALMYNGGRSYYKPKDKCLKKADNSSEWIVKKGNKKSLKLC